MQKSKSSVKTGECSVEEMASDQARPIIDFKRYISERTRNFTGCDLIFKAVNDWLTDPNSSRFFLITGRPGDGKTAISGRLYQFSEGVVTPPVMKGAEKIAEELGGYAAEKIKGVLNSLKSRFSKNKEAVMR